MCPLKTKFIHISVLSMMFGPTIDSTCLYLAYHTVITPRQKKRVKILDGYWNILIIFWCQKMSRKPMYTCFFLFESQGSFSSQCKEYRSRYSLDRSQVRDSLRQLFSLTHTWGQVNNSHVSVRGNHGFWRKPTHSWREHADYPERTPTRI